MAPNATIKRFEDNNATISAFLSGQVQLIAAGNIVAATILAKNPPRRPEAKFVIKNSPCFVGMNKNEPRLQQKVDAAIAQAKKDGTLERDVEEVVRRAAARPTSEPRSDHD